jgi:hypothetical protein
MTFLPYKTDAVLLINPNTILVLSIALKAFESVSWRNLQLKLKAYGIN